MPGFAGTYDVIVLGIGTMGSAACDHLARRGASVLGLEQFSIPHTMGASHGDSRLIRLCYFEHPDYVPLLHRTYALWEELEQRAERTLMCITGGIYIGNEHDELITGSLRSAREHDLPHEPVDHAELRRRYPAFALPENFAGVFEPRAGFVLPEATVSAQAELALRHGAHLHGHEAVRCWRPEGGSIVVETERARYAAGHLVVCAGAWSAKLLGSLGVELTATRQPLGWVWPESPADFEMGRFPIWGIGQGDGTLLYGFPMLKGLPGRPGLKVALHRPGPTIDPDTMDRIGGEADEQTFRALLQEFLPSADGPLLSLGICMYLNSPDGHFIVDRHPEQEQVTVATGFTGHGFKFAPVMGEVLADLALEGATEQPIGLFGLDRFVGV